ncbi:Uncharacterised protein [Propionibacterium australiense]|uniref:START-like domain n=2 Tax=Propionibacterium australiense TaxID=119981 RepID=A0A383S2S0_9ACTN|nr:START-like domain [Propionibacterium australiense]VEH90545.1 Uncharacterised protein [Propionibacterium australiense]
MTHHAPAFFRYTNADPRDINRHCPADDLMPHSADRWVRCIDINAPQGFVYRWLCQLTVAPYSIDWLDHPGRRSPRTLTLDAERLTIGQPFLIFAIDSFVSGKSISGRSRPQFIPVYGDIAVSYEALPRSPKTTRLQATACLSRRTPALTRTFLALGDKIMAGRQLKNLKALAEQSSSS